MWAYGPDIAVLRSDLAGYGREWKLTSAYAALITAISGTMPTMFMARLRL